MTAPPARAKLGMVRIADDFSAKGYADHDVYFLGVDNQWRVLNLAELGLPASDWTGPDGSGMGDLSPKGTHWAFVTTRHVIVLNLLTRKLQFLSLPGGRTPVPGRWTVRNTLIVGHTDSSGDLPTTSYEVSPKTGRSTLIKAPAHLVSVLNDGTRAVARWSDNQPYINYLTPINKLIARRDFDFTWDQHLGLQNQPDGQDSAVFLDSLGSAEGSDSKSMVAVVDQSLRIKASLPWPNRNTNRGYVLGWSSSATLILEYGNTLAAWCPGQSKISRLSTVSRNLAISMAMEVVDARCAAE